MPDKVLLIGCSWACGEFINDGEHLIINHPGMSEYLAQHYQVTNLARPSASNWQTCFAFRNYYSHAIKPDSNCVNIVIQTDPFRSAVSDKFDVDVDKILSSSSSLQDFYTRTLEMFYIKLNDLAGYYKTKIHMIGGLSDLDLDLLGLFENLVPLCSSWIQLMHPAHQPSSIPLILDPELLITAKKYNKIELVDQIIQTSDQNFLQAQTLMETDFFGPAFGDFHPSRKGHRVLADFIAQYFNQGHK